MNLTEEALATQTYKSWGSRNVNSIWPGSNFEPYKMIASSRSKGAEAEKLCAEMMERRALRVRRSTNSGHDRIIGGYKTEIKASTCWDETPNKFKWQQIRPHQDYDRIIFMGINPNDIQLYWATKDDLEIFVFGNDAYRQHAGKDGGQELYWIQSTSIPGWFRDIEDF
jgi:hypothetical protein